jgi:exodeoxyribonuclease V beta subunit
MALIKESTSTQETTQRVTLKNLNAATIELSGKHLIEASAGTGKTYNITRIYLRLLLERELTVEQILLMTFTKDATQELRGRIDSTIREALTNWHQLCIDDPFFAKLDDYIEANKGDFLLKREFLLKRALLFLDEAAIFTIHGFCQRVLNQYAFTSGLPFNANMAANSSEITLQVCQDWYRTLAKTDEASFVMLNSFWPTPESFLSSFSKAIGHTSELSVVDVDSITEEFISLARIAKHALESNTDLFENALIQVKKGSEQAVRRSELALLISWLERVINQELLLTELAHDTAKMPDAFIDGKRYARSKFKTELLEAFDSIKQVKEQAKKIANHINKAKAYAIVKSAIYTIREQVIEQKQVLNLLDFDDLINTLANCLNPVSINPSFTHEENLNQESLPSQENQLAKQLLAQYPVALIDEFQDTDPKQFGILQAIYYGNAAKKAKSGLFLIGDPKQAIYGFRGGDIFAYLNARSGCDHHWLMDTNWRSTPEMIAGYNQLFTKAVNESVSDEQMIKDQQSVFGFGIPYSAVFAGKESKNSLTVSNDCDKALQFIHFSGSDDESGEQGEKVSQSSRALLANWCANEIISLLATNVDKSRVKPKDIAILVRDGAEARDIKQALQQAGLDSVFLSDRANLLHSQQAKQLLCLLKGVLFPENERLFVAALSCGLLGYDAQKLHHLQQDEIAYQGLKFAFIEYRSQWQRQGFITMAINLMHQHLSVPQQGKDRCLTNLLHLFEILQAASVRLSQGQELLHWFEQQCHLETNDVEAELRLESDGDLIRLITQHGSKGLEYPYVFIPFSCRHKDPLKFGNKSVSYLEYHNEQGKLCLSLDGSKEAKKAMSDEAYAESIRLLYVAITRAESRCYVMTCAFDQYHLSPLGKTLQLQESDCILTPLRQLKENAPEAIGLREVSFDCSTTVVEPQLALNSVKEGGKGCDDKNTGVAIFIGNIERNWWLSSFSALSRNIRHAGVSNPDRDIDAVNQQKDDSNNNSQICFELVKGAHTGNLLHDILEHTDFTDPNWQESIEKPLLKFGELTRTSNELSTNSSGHLGFGEEDLINWLEQVLDAPFFQRNDEGDNEGIGSEQLISLSDISFDKTLRESEFYFPMQGQGTNALADLLTDHRNTAKRDDTAISRFPVMLPNYKKLSGMMHGFIDLIFEHQGKYYLCDYKSSHLGNNYQDYQDQALLDNVEKNYYDLQYLIYSLALHRYLKQTLVDYDVDQHFGGVYYFYLRGMTSESKYHANGSSTGVYYRKILADEINKLDKLFSVHSSDTAITSQPQKTEEKI